MQECAAIIVISALVSTKHSISMSFICIFSFVLWPFIEFSKITYFIVSLELFVFSDEAVMSSRAVWLLTVGIKSFKCSVEGFPLCLQ